MLPFILKSFGLYNIYMVIPCIGESSFSGLGKYDIVIYN